MLFKTLPLTLCLLLLMQETQAAEQVTEPVKSNARAYRAHLMSFIWPSDLTSEQVDYQNIYQLDNIQRFENEEEAKQSASILDQKPISENEETNPFYQYQTLINKKVTVLSNQTWPMIFEEQGSVNFANFHSQTLFDGYPELTGQIQVKLGRYLETEINYKHFLFDSFTTLKKVDTTPINNFIFDELDPFFENEEVSEEKIIRLYEPALLLAFDIKRKTASKKLNYLDHPIIGSLLYFEPISVDDAEHELMLQALTEEEIVRDAETGINFEKVTDEANLILLNNNSDTQ